MKTRRFRVLKKITGNLTQTMRYSAWFLRHIGQEPDNKKSRRNSIVFVYTETII